MKYSVVLTPTIDAHHVAVRAEELGFSRVWFFDSPMLYSDIFVSMAMAADRTHRIELGTSVVVPTNRIAPVTANAIASLNALAPGRVILGLGTGFTARNTMGRGPIPLADLQHHVDVIRALLDGTDVIWSDVEGKSRVQFLQENRRFQALNPRIPLWISGMGPRSMVMAAREADGWMAFAPGADYGVQYLDGIADACRRQARAPSDLQRTIMSTGCVLADGEPADSPRGLANGGPLAAVFFHNLVEGSLDFSLPEGLSALADAYRSDVYDRCEPRDAKYLQLHRDHLVRVRDEERPYITGELIRMASFTGTAEELQQGLKRLEDRGCDEFAIQLMVGHEDEIDTWARLFGLSK